jgi:hypothetical protein
MPGCIVARHRCRQAEWLDSMFSVPEKMTSDIYSTDPDIVSPDCQDSVGNAYDTYFPSWARSLVSAGLSSDIPNGDEVCHLICEQGCGARWMDPSGYFIAVEIDCGLPIYVKGEPRGCARCTILRILCVEYGLIRHVGAM